MNKRNILLGLIGILLFCLALYLPIPQQRILSRGVDSFATHRSLFGKHVLSQDLITQGAVSEVGAILVDYFRANQLVDVTVTIEDVATQTTLTNVTIAAQNIQDDAFATAPLPQPIGQRRQHLRLHFTAPDATVKNPIGIRYDPDLQPGFARYENSQEKSGTFAIQVTERVPAWRFFFTHITQNPVRSQQVALSILITLILAALGSRLGFSQFTPRHQKIIEYGAIIILVILALSTRWHIIRQLGGVSGGDPYNYLFITDSLTNFQNPFAGVKRLPGYPLLLAPAYLLLQIDDQLAMRLISTVSAGGALFMLFLLTRSLKLPWAVQLLAPALLAWQKDFVWVSTRPEPYTFYTFLLLASLVLWFNQTKRWQQITFGFVLGYAAMTRQEGFVLAAILALASVIRELYKLYKDRFTSETKSQAVNALKKLSLAYLPALLLVLPFFIHNTVSFGNPIYTPYFKGERLQIVDSYAAFKDAMGATWGVLGSMFKPQWDQLERVGFGDGRFRAGVIGTLAWFAFWYFVPLSRRRPVIIVAALISIFVVLWQLWIFITANPAFAANLLPITAGIIYITALPFLVNTKLPGILITTVALSQILIATWFHPFPKHYQQSYPLIALFITTALIAPLFRPKFKSLPTIAIFSILLPLIIPIPLLAFKLYDTTTIAIDDQNANTALDSVVYRATQAARQLSGPHGFDQAYLPARLYFEDQAKYYTPEDSTPDKDQQWLEENNIKTLVVINDSGAFQNLSDDWQLLETFKSAGKEEFIFESYVYQRP